MSDGLIDGFERRRLPGDGATVDTLVGGSGPPVLLLHGYPQTRVCWAAVAAALADRFTVVAPDLRGYGRSDQPADADGAAYSKRAMARDQVAAMAALGFDRFAVAGHDRGGRVGYRLALDRPEAVSRLAVLDIVPTADAWAGMDAAKAVKMFHWGFLAQPGGLPERLIAADPDFFVRWTLEGQAAAGFEFPPESLRDYLACARGATPGFCGDYRAGWGIDRELDEGDRGRRRIAAPVLVLWGERGAVAGGDPVGAWRAWADDVRGHAVPGGHFCPEEAAAEVAAALAGFFAPLSRPNGGATWTAWSRPG